MLRQGSLPGSIVSRTVGVCSGTGTRRGMPRVVGTCLATVRCHSLLAPSDLGMSVGNLRR